MSQPKFPYTAENIIGELYAEKVNQRMADVQPPPRAPVDMSPIDIERHAPASPTGLGESEFRAPAHHQTQKDVTPPQPGWQRLPLEAIVPEAPTSDSRFGEIREHAKRSGLPVNEGGFGEIRERMAKVYGTQQSESAAARARDKRVPKKS